MEKETSKVQLCLDFLSIEEAVRVGKVVYQAGADWIEVGSPLIIFHGLRSIDVIAKEFPDRIILADLKALDGVAKYVKEVARRGARIATVAAVAADASIREGVRGARESGIKITADLYAVRNLEKRAKELDQMGVDYLMIHLGADEKSEDPTRDPLQGLSDVVKAVSIPVGVVVFTKEEAMEAVRQGARFVVAGNPLLSSKNLAYEVTNFVKEVKEFKIRTKNESSGNQRSSSSSYRAAIDS